MILRHPVNWVDFGVIDGPANVRIKPGGEKVGSLNNLDFVQVYDVKDKWYRIKNLISGLEGWTFASNFKDIKLLTLPHHRNRMLKLCDGWDRDLYDVCSLSK